MHLPQDLPLQQHAGDDERDEKQHRDDERQRERGREIPRISDSHLVNYGKIRTVAKCCSSALPNELEIPVFKE